VKYRELVAYIICSTIISACGTSPTAYQTPTPNRPAVIWTLDSATASEKEKAKNMVIGQLKDPESARFGEIWALQGSNGERAVCGYVNARNSYGGYTGEKMFTLSELRVIFEGDSLGDLLPKICTPRTVR